MSSKPVNVNDFKELARSALPKMYYDFYAGGAEDEHTLRENIRAFHSITIRPRVLLDVSQIDMSTTVLGHRISAPILVAPTSAHMLAFHEGELATARAAAAAQAVLSYSSTRSIEEVAASWDAVRFFQLYVFKRRDITALIVQRAETCGYKAIVVTLDTPWLGRREADMKNNYLCFTSHALMIAYPKKNLEGLMSVEINSGIKWLRSITSLPILLRGILTREDATKAVEAGVDGIIVSNHGGRQLDFTPPTILVLEEAVKEVPVVLDGGVRRGTDVFKGLALGAQAILTGRAVLFGPSAKGEGARTVLEMLKNELETTMALSGCPSIRDITRNHVRTQYDKLQAML